MLPMAKYREGEGGACIFWPFPPQKRFFDFGIFYFLRLLPYPQIYIFFKTFCMAVFSKKIHSYLYRTELLCGFVNRKPRSIHWKKTTKVKAVPARRKILTTPHIPRDWGSGSDKEMVKLIQISLGTTQKLSVYFSGRTPKF